MQKLPKEGDKPPNLRAIATTFLLYIKNWTNAYPYWAIGSVLIAGLLLIGQFLSSSGNEQSIRRVLGEDKAISQETSQKMGLLDKYWDGSTLVAGMAGQMDSIDLTGCPQDFQFAYKRHVAAWMAVARVKSSNEGVNGTIKSFFTGGLSIMPAWSELDTAMNEVLESWKNVQQIAISHGVSP